MSRLKTLHFQVLWPLDTTSTVIFNLFDLTWPNCSIPLGFLNPTPCTRGPINPISYKWLYFSSVASSRLEVGPAVQSCSCGSAAVINLLGWNSCGRLSFPIFVLNQWLNRACICAGRHWDVHPSIPSSFYPFIISLIDSLIHSCNVGADCLLACLLACSFPLARLTNW